METPEAITYLLSIITMGLGWWLRMTWDAQKELRRDLGAIERALPDIYVRRDDFNRRFDELFDLVRRIDEKLDGKADKP